MHTWLRRAGLPLQKNENERLTHITTLASTILKAPCAFVILGTESGMVLASAIGTDDEDDAWLPSFCAWALGQPSGNLTIEDAEKDSRYAPGQHITGLRNAEGFPRL